jgi:hypothetical protein
LSGRKSTLKRWIFYPVENPPPLRGIIGMPGLANAVGADCLQ